MRDDAHRLTVLHIVAGYDPREAQGATIATIVANVAADHHLVTTAARDTEGFASVTVLEVPMRSMWDRATPSLAAAVATTRPDVVHLHGGPFTLFRGPGKWAAGLPIVVSLYAWPRVTPRVLREAASLRRTLGTPVVGARTAANTVLPVRLAVARARRHGVVSLLTSDPEVRTRLAASGMVIGMVEGVARPSGLVPDRSPEPARFVFAGRPEETRGPDLLAEAVATLTAEGLPATARCCFLAPPSSELIALLDRPGVEWSAGPVDLRDEFRRATAVVLPFRHDTATLRPSYVAAEAQAAGVPVVVTDVACLVDAVVPGATGDVVPRGDLPALTASLRRLASEPALVHAWGVAGAREAARRWTQAGVPVMAEWAYSRAVAAAPSAVSAEHFEALAAQYHEHAFDGAGLAMLSARDLAVVDAAVRAAPGREALDVGVGSGRISVALAGLGCTVTGVERSANMLAGLVAAEPVDGRHRRLVRADVGAGLPVHDETADIVTCLRVLKYVERWPAAIAELVRATRPGGVIVVDMTNHRSPARFGYPAGLVRGCTWAQVQRVLAELPVTVEAVRLGPHLLEPCWRLATTPRQAAFVQRLDRVLERLLGRVFARSWMFTLRREDTTIGQTVERRLS